MKNQDIKILLSFLDHFSDFHSFPFLLTSLYIKTHLFRQVSKVGSGRSSPSRGRAHHSFTQCHTVILEHTHTNNLIQTEQVKVSKDTHTYNIHICV